MAALTKSSNDMPKKVRTCFDTSNNVFLDLQNCRYSILIRYSKHTTPPPLFDLVIYNADVQPV
jgi:hypothetical protein